MDYVVWNVECGWWSVQCGVMGGVWTGMWSVNRGLWTVWLQYLFIFYAEIV